MKQTVEIKFIDVYSDAKRFQRELNAAYADGWYLHSWHVTDNRTFYAVLQRVLPDDLSSIT